MKYLIINADDFGYCCHINKAVIAAHQHGILTSASLMVNGDGCQEAVALAREHPNLGVGLHLVLSAGKATLPPGDLPDLVDREGDFLANPIMAGMKYYFARKRLYDQLKAEITAQLEKFSQTGLPLDHINGHVNIHLHPVILKILIEIAPKFHLAAIRIPQEPLLPTLMADTTNWGYKLSHWFIFGCLAAYARPRVNACGLLAADSVYGLLQSGRMTSDYLAKILPQLSDGIHEFYFHPSLSGCPEILCVTPNYLFEEESMALTSPQVRQIVTNQNISLVNYGQLTRRKLQ